MEACKGVNIAIMVGGFPRKEGMERKDVMSKNVSIYKEQASALEQHAAENCKVSLSFFFGYWIPTYIKIFSDLRKSGTHSFEGATVLFVFCCL